MSNFITDTKLINLTSDTATQYNNSTFLSDLVFETKGLLIHDKKIVNVELSLIHAEIPVSFYTINYTNNILKIKFGTNADTLYTIPVGNYNANTLITQILSVINNSNFSIQLNKFNGKLTFNYNTSFIIYTNNSYSIGQILGFNLNTSYSSSSNIINALYPLNLLGIKKLNISSSEIITMNYSSSMGMCSLLTSIPVDQPPFGLIIYENKSGIKHLIKNTEINKLDLQITDEFNNLINFNNINWSLLFSLVITYDLNIQIDSNNIVDNLPQQSTKIIGSTKSKPNSDLQQLEFLTTNNINE